MKLNKSAWAAPTTAIFLVAWISSCDIPDTTRTWYGGKTASLQSCLRMVEKTVKSKAGHTMRVSQASITTDRPDKVVGTWSRPHNDPRVFFICEWEETGTQGSFWQASVEISTPSD